MPMFFKRLRKELDWLARDPPVGYHVAPIDDDFEHWQGAFMGPPGSLYQGGDFGLTLDFPADYPFNPPRVRVTTKIFHPMIGQDGTICINCLLWQSGISTWCPAFRIGRLFDSIQVLLNDPYSCEPHSPQIAGNMHRTDRDLFERTAKEWTRRYASEARNQQAG
eukprot:scpid102904/ scgid31893/ Ubiquitin-conjugating enzyme E2 D2B; Ubiquitin carrier protein D2B; Ubiquitin-conjugating enzyme E2(17)KB 2B; Ubiquitin-conjugating enzyme E2-17 kDa 2B; Ubiquitin-protein ligase D2B &gt; Ubiquitin-conjugating enzyme E2 D2B; Ubiquitin carrier protein D2B; Ubiquitin-protein ligase D2B